MYTILCDDYVLHDSNRDNDGLLVIDGKCELEVNKTGSLTFRIPPTHPHYDKINKLTSQIKLMQNDDLIFCGRVLNDEVDFNNIKTVECEGELSLLLDSIQHKFQYLASNETNAGQNSVKVLLQTLIDNHNSQMALNLKQLIDVSNVSDKMFYVGNVTVKVDDNEIYMETPFDNTLNVIMNQFVNVYGGTISVRYANGRRYIDYIDDYTTNKNVTCTQEIKFGENIVNMFKYTKGEEIYTAIIPFGASSENATDDNNGKVNLTMLEDGTYGGFKKVDRYLYDANAVKKYGFICKTQDYNDVSNPTVLIQFAQEFLRNSVNEKLTISVDAVDLHELDVNIDSIRIADKIRCISEPHNINEIMYVKAISVDINNPANTRIQLELLQGKMYVWNKVSLSISDDSKSNDNKITQVEANTNKEIASTKDWVAENFMPIGSGGIGGVDLSAYARISDVNSAFNELASALMGV